ncbi:hypothetical protein Flavo103_39790 [Flavobacterium collinsii]|uniref:T9SS type A sorting domain-containing protein n=1 Tax=Flavobacterium collinsii TaxID=1114861 RepID=UPI0022C9CD9B|nr:T9SS type A sorting domain-containing protein [Flavobacterium collinsii]GIQ60843.1 hypothetical protein Flavo103_39790 [Flavobacterium collinsii]
MKKIYLLVFLLVCNFSFGQAPELGSYEIVFNGWAINDEHHNCGEAFVRLEFKTPIDNYKALNISYNDDRATISYTNAATKTTFKADKVPVSMFFSASRYDRQSCRGNRPHNSGRIYNSDNFHCFDFDFEFKQFKNVESKGDGLGRSSFNVKVRPILVIVDPGKKNDLPTDKNITIESNTGFLPSEYNWQYSFDSSDSNSWVDMTKFLGQSSFTTNAKEILGENAGEYHGRTIYLRQKSCNVSSNIVNYTVRQSAPEVVSMKEEKTRCFDTNDGKLIMKFNRPFFAGEKFTFSIRSFDEEHKIWQSVVCSSQDGSPITLDRTNTYEFPCNFSKGKYGIAFYGSINESNTGSPHTEDNPFIFNITSPTPVDFTLTKKNDINCFGGSDGAIDIKASGGVDNGIYEYSKDGGATWITFLNGDQTTINGLSLGRCHVKVRKLKDLQDTVGCIAKLSKDVEKELYEDIKQPLGPLQLVNISSTHPTFNKAENGQIIASISGGTPIDGKSYLYEWRNSKNELIDAGKSSTQFVNGVFAVTLKNVVADTYRLFITDARNCKLDSSLSSSLTVVLDDPEPIEIKLKIQQQISCNSANLNPMENGNKAANGILEAVVTGGVKFTGSANGGLPYKFIWSKYNTKNKLWEVLEDYTKGIAPELSEGSYSLNVEDANNVVQGTYNAVGLTEAIPTKETIAEPEVLKLSFDIGNVSCHGGNNGWATATVENGTAPYIYKWFNVDGGIIEANKISKLTHGEYAVEITDDKGCFVTGFATVTEPSNPVEINYSTTDAPTFAGATNGKIVAQITGGTAFDPLSNKGKLYNYKWMNSAGAILSPTTEIKEGVYTITLNGVRADDYFLTIEDRNYDKDVNQIVNCSVVESKVKLTEPDPLEVVFEIVRTISCNATNEFGDEKDITPNDGQRDESQDGILKAHVSGGISLASDKNNGLPYYFYWKKQQEDGTWITLPHIKGETASELSHGNYALNIKDGNGIMLGTYVDNVLAKEIDATQLMQEPPKLAVTITKGDVFCNGGNDGWATANVTGGTPPYEYKWSNEVEVDKNTVLRAGEYWIFITDAKGCTTQESVIIIEPKLPLAIKYNEVLDPSFYKATNGKIVVEVTGGTIFSDNSYWFEWKNSKGIKQTSTTTQFNNGIYTISLNGLPEEVYSLTIRDANYDPAVNKIGCTMVNSIQSLDDPEPLEVIFEVVRTISCNVSNEFGNETDADPIDNQRDESQDGVLTAHVKGGIQLKADKNNGLPYFYTWKKKQNDGSWKIRNDQNERLENISEGIYALNVEDGNGIKLGTYTNNVLVNETDAVQYMAQPEKLNLTFTKHNASCNNGDDGWAEAHVSGGTQPYTYQWSNGETTAKIENITTNNYFVLISDAKGCLIQGSIFVGDPKGILMTETVKNPTCFKGNDGGIQVNVTGGDLPYSYVWNTGATTKDLNNLSAGNYEVTITCPDCCIYKKRFLLKDPNPVVVDLGKDRTLCNDQVLDLDATIADQNAQYSWTSTNGFTSNQSKVSLTKAGTYRVKVTSALGCIGEDEIVIKTSQVAISSEFLLSSQAYLDEEVILVNTSTPFGESTNWVIPKGVKIVEQKEKYITLKFDTTGLYAIGLQQTQGECYATYTKNITVEQRSTLPNAGSTSQFMIDFVVTPNPSNGNFKAFVTLENDSAISLRLFSTSGQNMMIQKKESGKKKYEINFDTTLGSGMYVLVLETGQQTLVKKIIIY